MLDQLGCRIAEDSGEYGSEAEEEAEEDEKMAITVSRPKLNWRERLYLPAIVTGLAITFKHFKNLLLGRTKVTMQYPEQNWDGNLPEYYRGAPALVRDEDGRVRCVACQLCEFICPPRAIKIIPGEIPPTGSLRQSRKIS